MLGDKTAIRTKRHYDIKPGGKGIRMPHNLHRSVELNSACASENGKLGISTSGAGFRSCSPLEEGRDPFLLLLV